MSHVIDAAPPATQDPRAEVSLRFERLIRLVSVADAQAWMGLDITMPQFKAMLLLWYLQRARVGVLAEQLGVHVSNVSGIIDRLVEAGFVCREEDAADRRLVVTRLTPQGEGTLARLYGNRGAHLRTRLDRLSESELQGLQTGLEALLARW
ncbi:MAG TPA: MarR family transcriptional regulator [Chloroflexota bacterium]|nr:MarR family transcriptional regulator [Chloroflexota bacterium]